MKTKLFMLLIAFFAAVSGAQAQETVKKHYQSAVYQKPVPVSTGYVVPAPCSYPYGCDGYGYPYPPPPPGYGYVVAAPCPYPYGCDAYGYPYPPPTVGAAMIPVSLAIQAATGRHGGVSVADSMLGNPSALNAVAGVVGNLFLNIGR